MNTGKTITLFIALTKFVPSNNLAYLNTVMTSYIWHIVNIGILIWVRPLHY